MTHIRSATKHALLLATASLFASGASAAMIVGLNTGSAAWHLSNFTPTHQPYTAQIPSGTFGNVGTTAPTIAPHSAWSTALNSQASWIGATTNGRSFGTGGLYEYTLDLTSILTPGATYSFDADYIADNGLVGALYNSSSKTIVAPVDATDFTRRKDLTFSFVADTTSVFTLQIYNADNTGTYGPTVSSFTPSNTANPHGFILAGSLTETAAPAFIPEPSVIGLAGMMGLTLMRRLR
jgi:hypothetical protein